LICVRRDSICCDAGLTGVWMFDSDAAISMHYTLGQSPARARAVISRNPICEKPRETLLISARNVLQI